MKPASLSWIGLFLALVPGCTLATAGASSSGSGLRSVIKQLQKIESTTLRLIRKAENGYKKVEDRCFEQISKLKFKIDKNNKEDEELLALLERLRARYAEIRDKMKDLTGEITVEEAQLDEAKKVREEERAAFEKEVAQLTRVDRALKSAISILEGAMVKPGATGSLMQLSNGSSIQLKNTSNVMTAISTMLQGSMLNMADASRLMALAQVTQHSGEQSGEQSTESEGESDEDDEDLGAPAADIYRFKGGGVVDALKNMSEQSDELLDNARNAEKKARYQYDELRVSMGVEINDETEDLTVSQKLNSQYKDETIEVDIEETDVRKLLKEFNIMLKRTFNECMVQAEDHVQQKELRGKELEAIKGAIRELEKSHDCSGETCPGDTCPDGSERHQIGFDCCECEPLDNSTFREMSGSVFKKKLYDLKNAAPEELAEEAPAPSFLQQRLSSRMEMQEGTASGEPVKFLRNFAKKHHSTSLALLASQIETKMKMGSVGSDDPFVEVKGLINDVIAKLVKEGLDAANHKDYCDDQSLIYATKKEKQENAVTSLKLYIEREQGVRQRLKDEVVSLTSLLADNKKMQHKLAAEHTERTALYTESMEAAATAIEAIRLALHYLKNYYESSEVDAGSSQGSARTAISMLEVLQSQYQNDRVERKRAYREAESLYNKQMSDLAAEDAATEIGVANKKKYIGSLDSKITVAQEQFDEGKESLDTTLKFLEELDADCFNRGQTMKEKWIARETELDGLKQALEILDTQSQSVFLQISAKRSWKRSVQRSLRGLQLHGQ